MSDSVIISVEHLSKRYIIGHKRNRQDGLRHRIEDAARAPWRWLRAKSQERRARSKEHGALPGSDLRSASSHLPSSRATREEFWALKDVSFEVKHGDVVGIIGRNGAGKSTLLKILGRITEPSEGRVRIRGRVASLLEVGTGFHPELTGRENIFLNGAILGMTKVEIRRKFDEIVAFSEIERFLDTPVKRYSSGMYVRLAFAVAAHLEPEILIVDEVLAVGDAQFQEKCLGKMQDISKGEGRTVLFVSHNMSAVRSLCQTTVLLVDGTLAQIGTVNAVVDSYLAGFHAADSLDFDVSELHRSAHYGSQMRINHVRINSGTGIWHGQPLEIEFEFECLADLHEVAVGIGFCSSAGARVLTLDSDLPGERWNFKRGQRRSARLKLPELLLEPDFYTLDIGSRSGDNYGLDYLPQCARVAVLPGPTTPPVISLRDSGRGGVRQPAEWMLLVADCGLKATCTRPADSGAGEFSAV